MPSTEFGQKRSYDEVITVLRSTRKAGMSEAYVFEKFGPAIPDLKNSDLCEVMLIFSGLRAVVHLGKGADEEDRFLEVVFKSTRGFRYLDEGDLLPYWSSGAVDNSKHLVHEIKRGGWAEQEEKTGC